MAPWGILQNVNVFIAILVVYWSRICLCSQADNHGNNTDCKDKFLCPPGFKLSNENETRNDTCVCADTYQQSLHCNQHSMTAFLKNDNWMGLLPKDSSYSSLLKNECSFVAVNCPPGYCYSNLTSDKFLLPKNNLKELNELVCGPQNRTGTVCGKCIEGFGPAINSRTYKCVNCSDHNMVRRNIAKYIVSVYIPLAVLFTVLILFDIRLTTGPANAFILYCQVVASTFDLNADGQIPLNLVTNSSDKLLNAVRIPYSTFNLEFIENFLPPLCLGTQFNTLSLLLMKYVVALAPMLMIVVVILCVKLTSFITNRCCRGKSMFHEMCISMRNRGASGQHREIIKAILPAFATFLLLSYNKFSTISTFLVVSEPLLRENGSAIYPSRVYYNGEYSTHDFEYRVRYLLPATIIFLTFVAIPPLLLLDYPLRIFEWCLSKVNCLWKYYRVDMVHVFLDTFQGCYKNKMRFFAGLYFVFRLTINITYIFAYMWLLQFAVQQVACVIMIALLALCQPYKKKWLNYVDILIFTNLSIVNSLSLYLYSFSQINLQTPLPASAFAVQYILVLLPLFYMISYVAWCLTQPCHCSIKHRLQMAFTYVMKKTRLNFFQNPENFSINASQTSSYGHLTSEHQYFDSVIFERAKAQNMYKKLNENERPNEKFSPESRRLSSNFVVRGYRSTDYTLSQTY